LKGAIQGRRNIHKVLRRNGLFLANSVARRPAIRRMASRVRGYSLILLGISVIAVVGWIAVSDVDRS
jgi:hypothetical protein